MLFNMIFNIVVSVLFLIIFFIFLNILWKMIVGDASRFYSEFGDIEDSFVRSFFPSLDCGHKFYYVKTILLRTFKRTVLSIIFIEIFLFFDFLVWLRFVPIIFSFIWLLDATGNYMGRKATISQMDEYTKAVYSRVLTGFGTILFHQILSTGILLTYIKL